MEFIWRAPFRDKIGSACTFALATRGSDTAATAVLGSTGCQPVGFGCQPKRTLQDPTTNSH
ncbi:MAG: hypothetical protein DME52_07810 [Verrucomicrobia bacterium]|nr:MAG: hypothetical protein DME52_07810 [Verrucomicrobiota bacterium]